MASILLGSPQSAYAAQCGFANGSSYSSAPQSVGSLCVAGTPGAVSGSGPWNWTCSDGGGTVNCSSGICGVTFEWREGTFGACDCTTRLQSRGVWCYRNGTMTDPDQSGCYANAGPKPAWQQSCTPSGCVVPVAGACDNGTVNGCSAGSAFDITSDASNDYWKCSGSGGGANSGQCQKAKPPSEPCISGAPQNGQTQCPTNSCFFSVSGGDYSLDPSSGIYFRNADQADSYGPLGSLVGGGSYSPGSPYTGYTGRGDFRDMLIDTSGYGVTYSYATADPAYPLKLADARTFDAMVLGPKTRVVIFKSTGYGGGKYFDMHGPAAIFNYIWRGDQFGDTSAQKNDSRWTSEGFGGRVFWSDDAAVMVPGNSAHTGNDLTDDANMQRWGRDSSIQVMCDP